MVIFNLNDEDYSPAREEGIFLTSIGEKILAFKERKKILSSLQGENNFLEKAVILREEENSPNLQEEKNCSVSRQEINFLF